MRVPEDPEHPRFLTDEDFNLAIVTSLRRVRPHMDIWTIQGTGLLHAGDPQVLAFAMEHDRILLSHDMRTMPYHFAAFLVNLLPDARSPGVILLPQNASIGLAIEWILEIWEASSHGEWRNLLVRLPL